MNKTKGHFIGLVPLIVFLVLYMGVGLFSGSFDNMPLMVGILIATAVALLLDKPSERLSLNEKIEIFCHGAGESTLVLMVLIFILAGAFYGVASGMHAVDSVVNLGLTILPSNMILPGLFLIGCLLSFSMGTSMGTVTALMPIAINIASKTGINVAFVSGIVVGGAMFGDNLSFISDTTIAATRTQEVQMKDKFKTNIIMVLPAVIINLLLLFIQNPSISQSAANHSYSLVNLIPYVLVIVLSLVGMNVLPVMTIGVISGIIIGVIHDGMKSMQDMALIALFVGGLVGLMHHLGGIDYLLDRLTSKAHSKKRAELSIAALVSFLDIATTNNTVSIITAGPIAKDIADEYGVSRKRVASILDIFSSAFNGLLPYAGQLLVAAGLAKVSPTDIMVYNWYSILMIVSGLVFILIGDRKEKN